MVNGMLTVPVILQCGQSHAVHARPRPGRFTTTPMVPLPPSKAASVKTTVGGSDETLTGTTLGGIEIASIAVFFEVGRAAVTSADSIT